MENRIQNEESKAHYNLHVRDLIHSYNSLKQMLLKVICSQQELLYTLYKYICRKPTIQQKCFTIH